LLKPEIIQANYFRKQLEKQNEYKATFVKTVSTKGEKIYYAIIADIYIPKGYKPNFPLSPKEKKRFWKISYDCAIQYNISFIGGNEESGELEIFFAPLEYLQEDSYYSRLKKGTREEWLKNTNDF